MALTKTQLAHIEANIRAAADQKDYDGASVIAFQAALQIEIALGSEAQSRHFRHIENRYANKAQNIEDQWYQRT